MHYLVSARASDALPALQPLPSSSSGVDVSSLSFVQKNRERTAGKAILHHGCQYLWAQHLLPKAAMPRDPTRQGATSRL